MKFFLKFLSNIFYSNVRAMTVSCTLPESHVTGAAKLLNRVEELTEAKR